MVVMGLSGGLDSVTLMHFFVKVKGMSVRPMFFYYGQKHAIEHEFAEWNVKKLQSEGYDVADIKYVDMSFMKDILGGFSALVDDGEDVPKLEDVLGEPQIPTYVPFRNYIFLGLMAAYAESIGDKFVALGIQRHDVYSGYWDTSLEFAKRVDEVFELNRQHRINVIAPFVNLHKAEEIIIGSHIGVDYSKTWSSYKVIVGDDGEYIADYDNPTSRDRIMAFAQAGIRDPIKYNKRIDWDRLFEMYQKYDDGDYEEIIRKVNMDIEAQISKKWYL